MEKIIFFGLVIPIFAFVLYLGVNAIMKGTEAKNALKEQNNLRKIESLEKKLLNNLDENSYSELIKLKSQLNSD